VSAIVNPGTDGGGGGGAPDTAQYLALTLDATLTAERKFVPAEGLTATDGGANGNYSLAATSYVLDRSVTSVDVSVSTTVTIYSYIIQPNMLGTDRCIRFFIAGDYLTNSAVSDSFTLAIALGATNMYVDGTIGFVASATRRPWSMELYLAAENSTLSQVLGGVIAVGVGAATTGIGDLGTDEINALTPIIGNAALSNSNTLTFIVSVRHLVGVSTSWRKRIAYAELL
jgi:hypothetical protein